ncbi:MAG: acyl-CoA dehydrogenase family protein [Myxococcota bacterium]
MKTHEVLNQVPPLSDVDLFAGDAPLKEAVIRSGGEWGLDTLHDFGTRVGSAEMFEHARLANTHRPTLQTFDRLGHRINAVEFHPSYHALMATSMEAGLHAQPWTDARAGAMAVRAAKSYLMTQVEAGHGCPITMTFASVPALRHQPDLADEWIPRITSTTYDPRNLPADQKTAVTVGMAMTEKQGGSDVRANTTRAVPQGDGSFRLTGHKWFCSAPMCDIFLTLAYESEDQLSCFLVPRWTPDGVPNAMNLQRLKDKLGDRANASSEIEYDGAWATRIGEPGRGVRTIIEMVQHTRIDCVVASSGLMRQTLSQAIHHADHRRTFGKRLLEQPLMQNVLADIALEVEAATAMSFRLVRAFQEGAEDANAAAFARIGTAVGKYYICKRAPQVAYEAMECLGGNGYVEEHVMARLYRQAPLNSIWEGSGNVICLDVLRAMGREPQAMLALRAELMAATGQDARYDAFLQELEVELQDPTTLEARARRLVERLALGLQASILLQEDGGAIAEAFVQSRLVERHGTLGTLPSDAPVSLLLERAHPLHT